MSEKQGRGEVPTRADVAIVGAGFSGMYLIKLFREAGLVPIGMHCYVTKEFATRLTAFEMVGRGPGSRPGRLRS